MKRFISEKEGQARIIIKKLLNLLLIISIFSGSVAVLPSPSAAATSSATWTSKGDFENNVSTTATSTTGNQVSVSATNPTDDANVTLASLADAEEFSALAAGYEYSLGVKIDGTLWTWGKNDMSQLGDGTNTTPRTFPSQVGLATNWKSVAAGFYHSLGVKTDGTLWSWGHNAKGQLGDTTTTNRTSPVQVGLDNNWKSIAAGEKHSLGVKTDGSLWSWGDSTDGQLGGGITRNYPAQVGLDNNWKSVAAGEKHSLGVKTDGTLWSWGYNGYGQLGGGSARNFPAKVGSDNNWKNVAAGKDHSLGLKANGTLWSWGFNGTGELGDTTTTNRTSPVQVGAETNWKSIAAGEHHSLGAQTGGVLSAWGFNASGQLGDSTTTNRFLPVSVGVTTNWLGYYVAPYSVLGTIQNFKISAGAGNKNNWSTISWNSATPANTLIKFRTRGADTESGLSSAIWSNYYVASGSSINNSDSQWLEIEATLESIDGVNTPILNDFKVDYDTVSPSAPSSPAVPNAPVVNILNTNLSLVVKPRVVTLGKTAIAEGQLKDSSGKPVVGKKVSLQAKVFKITKKKVKGKIKLTKKWIWKTIAKVTTNTQGIFSKKLKPKNTTSYRAVFGKDVNFNAANSKTVKVTVKKKK